MGLGELIGMRWILWNGGTEVPDEVFGELGRIIASILGPKE